MMCALCNYLCICSSHSWLKMLLKIVILNGFISVLETRLVDLVRRQPIRGGLVSKTLPFPICLLTYASPIFYNTFFAFLAYYDMQCIHTKIGVSPIVIRGFHLVVVYFWQYIYYTSTVKNNRQNSFVKKVKYVILRVSFKEKLFK